MIDRRTFFKFNILVLLVVFYEKSKHCLLVDKNLIIVDGWILKKDDLI